MGRARDDAKENDDMTHTNLPTHEDLENIVAPIVRKEPEIVAVDDVKLKIQRVKVSGLCRTKSDIVVEQIKHLLSANSLQSLMMGIQEIQEKFQTLDVFRNVEVLLDTAKGPGAKKGQLDVTFFVKEKGRLHLGVSAHAGTQSGDASLSASVRNVFGRAEVFKLTSSTTLPHFGQSQQMEFHKMHYADLNKRLLLTLGHTKLDHPFSGFQENILGSLAQLQFISWLGHHKLSWNCDWREVFGFPNNASIQVRSQAGHSLKSSIMHTVETDKRDDPVDPYEGYYARVVQEFAGLGGDIVFGKAEIHSALYHQIWNDLVGSVTLWAGIMRPITASRINDRFFLGGTTTLRGFGMWGVGPHESGYSLGGEAYWAAGLHLYHPLPFVHGQINQFLKLHAFLTTGKLFGSGGWSPRELLAHNRLSVGFGLLLRIGVGRVELNYSIPLKAQSQDRLLPGLQLGVGLEFL